MKTQILCFYLKIQNYNFILVLIHLLTLNLLSHILIKFIFIALIYVGKNVNSLIYHLSFIPLKIF
nr:MAG TPA: hypothetical protein [Caudoviricetes sp.]